MRDEDLRRLRRDLDEDLTDETTQRYLAALVSRQGWPVERIVGTLLKALYGREVTTRDLIRFVEGEPLERCEAIMGPPGLPGPGARPSPRKERGPGEPPCGTLRFPTRLCVWGEPPAPAPIEGPEGGPAGVRPSVDHRHRPT